MRMVTRKIFLPNTLGSGKFQNVKLRLHGVDILQYDFIAAQILREIKFWRMETVRKRHFWRFETN